MAFKVSVGASGKKDIRGVISEGLLPCLDELRQERIDLALVFATAHLTQGNLLNSVQQNLPAETPIIGCSAEALITSERVLNQGMAIMLISNPGLKVASYALDNLKGKDTCGCAKAIGASLMSTITGAKKELCLFFHNGSTHEDAGFINGLKSTIGEGLPIFGAEASNSLSPSETFQYHNENVMRNGSTAALIAGSFKYAFGLKHGFTPLGISHNVTMSNGNTVWAIDGRKASMLYEEYFAKTIKELQRDIRHINMLYPLGINIPEENIYILRNIISINDDGSIITQGLMPKESKIRLMMATKESCLEAARQAAFQVKADMHEKKIAFLLAFGSASRGRLLGGNLNEELKAIKEELGVSLPIIGCYGHGQYAPLKSSYYLFRRSYYHNQAISVLGFAS